MNLHIVTFRIFAVLFFLSITLDQTPWTKAQEQPGLQIAGSGFVNPRGFAFDPTGQLLVAEAGVGGENVGSTSVEPPVGPILGGGSGSVSVTVDRCPTTLVSGLPSVRTGTGETFGPSAIAVIADRTFVLVSGGGAPNGNADMASGVYELVADGTAIVADLEGWLDSNPVADPSDRYSIVGGVWSAMVANPNGDGFLVVEQGAGQVVSVSLDGTIERVVDLSQDNAAPSSIAIGPDEAVYVGFLTREPHESGSATVEQISNDGSRKVVWTGLTLVTGIAVDQQGVLYASELSGSRDQPPYFVPGTGRVVRQTGPDSSVEVVTQLNFPGQTVFGQDGRLYISLPMNGADTGTGLILSANVSSGEPLVAGEFDLTPPSCLSGLDEVVIVVDDLGINPSTITIKVGTTVTWRTGGEFDHAVASEPDSTISWDSGIMSPGDVFSVTFDQQGTYIYFDGLYPERTAEIIVVAE